MADAREDANRRRLEEARAALDEARAEHAARVRALADARRTLAALRARRGGDGERTRTAREDYEKALADLIAARRAVVDARATVGERLRASLPAGVADEVARLSADVPVALLPVRLETRFARGHVDARFAGSLKLRIYPDAICAEHHEPLLTEKERDAGRDYWRRAWAAADERGAWSALLKETRPPRAAWIVRVTAPTNLDQLPAEPDAEAAPDPEFGDVPLRPDNWTARSEARLLPDRWLVLAYRRYPAREADDVVRAESGPVDEPLALTLRLGSDGEEAELESAEPLSDDGLTVDPELMWSFDFTRAVSAGMAVQLDLTQADLDRGFARILVLGVKSSLTPEQSAARLGELIDDHRYTRGFAFVPQGTQTNNTSGAGAGYPPPDPNGEQSFAAERDPARTIEGRDGERFARALGVASEHLLHVAGAERDEQAAARAMADALWPATIGYFLEQLMAPHFDDGAVRAAREYVVTYVRGRGPLPAFRVGGVPYGLLPVTAFAQWQPAEGAAGPARHLPPLLDRLRDAWLAAAAEAPRINRTADADQDLIDTLALDASAREAYVRTCLGPQAQANTLEFLGIEIPSWDRIQDEIETAFLAAAGLGREWAARVMRLSYGNRAEKFRFGLVLNDPDAPLSETAGLAFDYVKWIRTTDLETLRAGRFPEGVEQPMALLYLMLRHAYLTEVARYGRQILLRHRLLAADERWEHELVRVVPGELTPGPAPAAGGPGARLGVLPGGPAPAARAGYRPTIWEHLGQPVAGVTAGESLARFLGRSPAAPRVPEDAGLRAYRASLAALEGVPTAELERLFGETLDICSHRLDAWVTALAWQRLGEMRAARPQGCHLAAFGWLEDLRADPPPARRTVRLGGEREVSALVDDGGGYIYAPSMNHAAAAAVLRSGYLTRSGEAAQPYAVHLSSARVRTALWFMDTVRDGQPLGAALGYHFERGLHERHAPLELDKFIDDFRHHYHLVANKTTDSGEPSESIAARNVVDGLALRRAWQNTLRGQPNGIPWDDLRPVPSDAERAAIEAELRELDDVVDAIADVLMAESVYQSVRGSVEGAAASLDTMAKGVRPPEPEVALTPRGGTDLYHRVALILAGAPPAGAPWPVAARTPRARVEPYLNDWVAGLLPPPDKVTCRVSYPDPADPSTGVDEPITLGDLGLEPLDVLALALAMEADPDGSDFGRRIARDSELALRVAAVTGAAPGDPIDIDFDAADPAQGERTFYELLEVARAINAVLGTARPLGPTDLLPPERADKAASAGLMTGELAARASLALDVVRDARNALAAALAAIRGAPAGTDPPLDDLRAALRGASLLGVPSAFPVSRVGNAAPDRLALVAQGDGVLRELQRRHTDASAETEPIARVRGAFGRGFVLVPRFVPATADGAAAELSQALAHPPDLGPDPDRVLSRWFAQAARVRAALREWRTLDLYARTAGRRLTAFDVVQLPHEADAAWVGLAFASEDRRPPPGRVSLLLRRHAEPAAEQAWGGLLLDEWTERIPNREEDAAVAFHYDSPGAEAPQAVLLAVPPRVARTPEGRLPRWSLDTVTATLNETLDFAKMRAVEGERLGVLAQALPMTYLASNPADETISTSFLGLLVAQAVIAAVEA